MTKNNLTSLMNLYKLRVIKVVFLTVFLASILFGCQLPNSKAPSSAGSNASEQDTDRIEAPVIRVIDGDTFVANVDGQKEKVRLILVDTPETVHPTKPEEPYGKEASNFAKKTLSKQTVQLEMDVEKRDKYGRLLAYVYLKDGSSFNKVLLEKGYARLAVFPPNIKYEDEYKQAEEAAKEKALGIWSKKER
ncbi:thermonuclease family protein [Bacillus paralicheniformis]|uniref:thermonuclease family protein n=1 Tax=Bacillus paralicheniformis TaxID=1648923 RepID=UPI0022820317|nr:thermonuclease family protein [Bacillus paralicheniformis]MCY8152001.1 thermonuclease family protein [Bacillus paralicheniformis]